MEKYTMEKYPHEEPYYNTVEKQLAVQGKKTPELPFYHTEYDGLILPPFLKKGQASLYHHDFKTRPGDVFIVAFPKSGTNWVAYIVEQIATPQIPEKEYVSVGASIPYMEASTLEQLHAYPSPRYMYTHLPHQLLPRVNERDVKYLVVARNPRDVAVSQFHFMSDFKLIDFTGSWEEYIELFFTGRVIYGSYFEHVRYWWKRKDDDNVLFVRYEELKKNLGGQIIAIANFLGVDLSQENAEKIAERSTFTAMKSTLDTSTVTLERHKDTLFKKGASLLRKGIVGDWKNHFSDEQLARLNALYEFHFKDTGLEFEYS